MERLGIAWRCREQRGLGAGSMSGETPDLLAVLRHRACAVPPYLQQLISEQRPSQQGGSIPVEVKDRAGSPK